jgi:hypothetical protein
MVGLFIADWRLSGGSMRNIAERKPQTDPEAGARATVSHIQTTKKGPVFPTKADQKRKKGLLLLLLLRLPPIAEAKNKGLLQLPLSLF